MCGRFALIATPEDLAERFGVNIGYQFPELFNIAPTQPITIVSGAVDTRHAFLARWGLIPGWCKNPDDFPLLINARSETAAEKASFRDAMRHRRALIPATGFYEWRRPPGGKGQSQAFYVRPREGGLVGFGALWEPWMGKDGTEIDTTAVLTVEANETFMPIHHRLPVVIPQVNFSDWLDVRSNEPRHLQPMLKAADDDFWEAIPVSDLVNKVVNTGPEIQNRVEEKPIETPEPDNQMSLF